MPSLLFVVKIDDDAAYISAHLGSVHIRPVRFGGHLSSQQPILEAVRISKEFLRIAEYIEPAVREVALHGNLLGFGVNGFRFELSIHATSVQGLSFEPLTQGLGCVAVDSSQRIEDYDGRLFWIAFRTCRLLLGFIFRLLLGLTLGRI